jgi:hypothetical protein
MNLETDDLSLVPLTPNERACKGITFDSQSFWIAMRQYAALDIMTFSVGDYPIKVPISRLIIGSPAPRWRPKVLPKTVHGYKVFVDLHAKLVIGYSDNGHPHCYVGSLNLCDSSSCEIMVEIWEPQQEERLVKFFDRLWMLESVPVKYV